MGDLKPCPFCGSEAGISTRIDEDLWSHNQVEWTKVYCTGSTGVDCIDPSISWPTGATDENGVQLSIAAWNARATTPEVTALVAAATALRDQISRWHEGGPAAGPDESRALFEALDDAIAKWEGAQK